jgi:hypothetical protein
MRALMELWHLRAAANSSERASLHAQCVARAAEGAGMHEGLLRRLVALQARFEMDTAVFFLALYGSVATPVQVAQLLVASWPFAPTMLVLHSVLQARANSGSGSGSAAAAAPGARGRGRGRGGRGPAR